tara:strand:+ start:391 stop:1035 length:645 start_codon:yes stop_codon:yes gene_type:complete
MIIAIDGPAGSGKSTTAKLLAKELGYVYLDTGAMYRAITLFFINNKNDLSDLNKLSKSLEKINISIKCESDFKIFINNIDLSDKIRESNVDRLVSDVSKLSFVRNKLILIQRKFSEGKNIVVEGRDIGSNVFPNADFKFFLNADINERAKRRLKDKQYRGMTIEYLVKEIKKRDMIDSNREISPLIKVNDAIEINTTSLTIEQQVKKIYDIIKG